MKTKRLEAEVITLRRDIEMRERQNENTGKFIQKAYKHGGLGFIPLDELMKKETV